MSQMLEIFLAVIIIVLFALVLLLLKKLDSLKQELQQLLFKKQSQSVKYGKLTEQWLPFASQFPFNPGDFRFIGSPIDGIAFDENKIVFCEFKAVGSILSEKQKRIRQLVERKKVAWFELKIK